MTGDRARTDGPDDVRSDGRQDGRRDDGRGHGEDGGQSDRRDGKPTSGASRNPQVTAPEKGELKAVQAALAAEHAAVYGYGVVGGKIGEDRRGDARAAYDTHRARRDDLARTVRDLGGVPTAAAAAYALPFAVADAAGAVRLAAELEDRVAGAYADLVAAGAGPRRRAAADALRDAAVRAVRWRSPGVAFPGLTGRTGTRAAGSG